MAVSSIPSPDVRGIVAPVLPSLPAAAAATEPAPAVLPFLSPILRQRVQLLASAGSDPWIRLLSYDPAKAARLPKAVRSGSLDPHPVSGEVELDWDYDVQTRYRRLDQETLQAMVVLSELNLFFQLVYCVGDQLGGGDGWRIGEVSIPDKPPFSSFGGQASITEAERAFADSRTKLAANGIKTNGTNGEHHHIPKKAEAEEEDDDDLDYWARYDATPARTPAINRSPAPPASTHQDHHDPCKTSAAEDAYFSQYDSVQPAMDNHDPDEAMEHIEMIAPPPLGLAKPETAEAENETNSTWTLAGRSPSLGSERSPAEDERLAAGLLHPRPSSSTGSNASVAKLEEAAGKREQNEFGVKQHVSRSIRSLFLLARSSGIDRDEFERLVRTELDVLGMVEDDM